MKITRFTLIMGIVFLAIGILGFVPGLLHAPHVSDPTLNMDASYGRLFNLFPVNMLHNLVHLIFGVWGLVAARNFSSSVVFCRSNAVIYAVLAVAGLIPGLRTMFGLIPLFSHDIWLHAAIAVATGYFGFVAVNREVTEGPHTTSRATV